MTTVEPTSGRPGFRLGLGRFRPPADRRRAVVIGVVVAVVLLVALAVALGGSGTPAGGASGSASTAPGSVSAAKSSAGATGLPGFDLSTATGSGSVTSNAPTATAPERAGASQGLTSGHGSATTGLQSQVSGSTAGGNSAGGDSAGGDSVTATRIVKTGSVELTVPKGKVAITIARLSTLATDVGGYVGSSETDSGIDPSGSITLRIPVAKFGSVVASAGSLGKIIHQSTHAEDVTGKYVDLTAQEHALQQTHSTYLTILSRATTIGATLAVQQRVDEVQQQIDQLHGQIKLLGKQSAYSTLTADVTERGSATVLPRHHARTGLAKAWTTSWHRFNRGIDAMVAAIGPLVLALIILAVVALLLRLALRATSRARTEGSVSGP